MNELWNRVYQYGTCGLAEETVNELLKILDGLEELQRLAEIGKAVERATEEDFGWVRFETEYQNWHCPTDIDISNLLKWFRAYPPNCADCEHTYSDSDCSCDCPLKPTTAK